MTGVSDMTRPKTAHGGPRTDRGLTLWLTGLPSAGKSTIADGVVRRLRASDVRCEALDGDDVRRGLTHDLGFSRADREENVRRIGYVARKLSGHGVITLVPVIAPYETSRKEVRAQHQDNDIDFAEAYVATPVDVCSNRDVKGLYARQRAGALTGLTGVDDPYEPPAEPDLLVPAHTQTVVESVDTVYRFLMDRTS
jgi:adenylylsulfate kinase